MSSLPERKRVLKGPLSESRHIPYRKRALWSVEENLDFLLEARKLHGSNLTKLNHPHSKVIGFSKHHFNIQRGSATPY